MSVPLLFMPAEIASLQVLIRHYQVMDPKPVEPEVFYREIMHYIRVTIIMRQLQVKFAQVVLAQLVRPQFNLSEGLIAGAIARVCGTVDQQAGSGAYSAMRRYADRYNSPASRQARARQLARHWMDLAAPINPAEEAEGLSPER